MKKFLVYMACATAAVMGSTSCSDFGDVNIDPEHLNEGNVPLEMLFTNAQHQALGSDWDVWRNGCIYAAQWMNHVASFNWQGYAMYQWSDGYSAAYWDGVYSGDRGAIRDVTNVLMQWKEDPAHEIDYQIARIMRVYVMHRMTDLYGDIPYTQAGQPREYSYPVYDRQQDIYMDMLNQLNEAQAALKGAGTAPMSSHDVYYQGNTDKWAKFANSLMLRIAMRMTKVDPATAETWVKTAVNNGLFASNEDNAMLLHTNAVTTNDTSEPYAKIYAHEDRGNFFVNKFFIDMLKETKDPRLSLIATVCEDPRISVQEGSNFQYGNTDPEVQQGFDDGFDDDKTSDWFIGNQPGYEAFKDQEYLDSYRSKYSTINRYTYSNPTSPTFICTYAQTQLLLAEAALRGWVSGSAQTYYENGVRAAMEQFAQFPNATALYNQYLTADAVNQYLAENPFDAAKGYEQINTQYWINCFCDEYETFANWRRSGYPEMDPAWDPAHPYTNSDTGGTIPRRFRYPSTESSVNMANYNEAVGRLNNGDRFTSRVWWDVE
ncbi:MAG TPA: SusD/RagB family nutrient-binding outer membrane lipoprotein [Candidatus Parabacteroides intestinipullorum]|uniref:SusD/RagB family nutrient-binding outer membrane lipoprotein n=1 Tax=Candidatus Parabacteroides intestinipullorum TaxID=2838723 RepID=A0A9D1XAE9_9BACT|nr:SusD/RagB family nutrient-binding outer membrane lipoprotein [Candidatus Parabacteroides intestinipullorum]